jgi:hypothetical protein
MALSWKAVRRGDVYCAPACGGGCTWAKYQEARRLATNLARRLGRGWKPALSENLGWHYHAELALAGGRAAVHYYKESRHYTVYLEKEDGQRRQWTAQGMSATGTVRKVVLEARREAVEVDSFLKVVVAKIREV